LGYKPQREMAFITRERIPPSEKISKKIKGLVAKLQTRGKNEEILDKRLPELLEGGAKPDLL